MALAAVSSRSPSLADGGFTARPNQLELAVDTVVPLAMEEMMEFGAPCSKENLEKEMIKVDAPREPVVELVVPSALEAGAPCTEKATIKEPLERESPSPWGEFIEELALSLSGSSQILQVREAAPSHLERRSRHLDKKIKVCDIPVANRVEYRRADSFGEVPNFKSKGKASEDVLNEKMNNYLQMYEKQRTPPVIQAVRDLVEINA